MKNKKIRNKYNVRPLHPDPRHWARKLHSNLWKAKVEDARAYIDRALYKIMVIVREMFLEPQAYNLKNKDEFKIKIEVY